MLLLIRQQLHLTQKTYTIDQTKLCPMKHTTSSTIESDNPFIRTLQESDITIETISSIGIENIPLNTLIEEIETRISLGYFEEKKSASLENIAQVLCMYYEKEKASCRKILESFLSDPETSVRSTIAKRTYEILSSAHQPQLF